jgi:hypothetical protein
MEKLKKIYTYHLGTICSQSEQPKEVLTELKRGSKLLAQSHDCATVMAGKHVGLKAKLREQLLLQGETTTATSLVLCRITKLTWKTYL